MKMLRAALLAALLSPSLAWGALTLDSTTCSSGSALNCPNAHMSTALTSCTNANPSVCTFPTGIGAVGANTLLIAVVSVEDHGAGLTTTISGMGVGTSANYTTQWTLVPNSKVESTNGASATFYAVTAQAFTGERPTVTSGCTGGCTTGTEMGVQVFGFSSAFLTPGIGNSGTTANGTPVTTLSGTSTLSASKAVMTWGDSSGNSCTQTVTANATKTDNFQPDSPCANSDYYVAEWLTSTSSAGSITIGVSAPTNIQGTWSAAEVCDSTATACPDVGGATNVTLPAGTASAAATAPTVTINGAKNVAVVSAGTTATGIGPTISVVGTGISLDSTACTSGLAANCPKGTQTASTVQALPSSTFSTSAASTLAVACTVGTFAAGGGNLPTIAWNGSTPANASAFTGLVRPTGAANGDPTQGACAYATLTGALSGVSVVATNTSNNARTANVLVYLFDGADIGVSAFKHVPGTFSTVDVTITPSGIGSFVVGAFGDNFNTSGLSPLANTTLDYGATGNGGEVGIMRLTSLTTATTPLTFGATNNQAYINNVAYEIISHPVAASVTVASATTSAAAVGPTTFIGTLAALGSAGTSAVATAISIPHTTTFPAATTSVNDASIAVTAGSGGTGGAGNQTPGIWVNVTPSNMDLRLTSFGNTNFVEAPVVGDPARPSDLYTGATSQGIWKSTDFGQTWQGPINTGSGGGLVNQGAPWCLGVATNPANPAGPPIVYTAAGKASLGVLVSTDGGVSWTSHLTNNATASADSGNSLFGNDPYSVEVDPGDALHVLTGFHGFRGLSESTDGGNTWRTIQPLPSNFGTSVYPTFVHTGNPATTRTTWLTIAQWNSNTEGVWRTTDSGQTWTQTATFEHFHGNAQWAWTATNTVYIGATFGIYKSTDGGQTWTTLATFNENGCAATATKVYCENGWAAGGTSDPQFAFASLSADTAWTRFTYPGTVEPAAMNDGAHKIAVTRSGSNYILVSGNYNGGLWRYVEAGDGSAIVGLPSATASPVATAITVAAAGPKSITLASASSAAAATAIGVSVPAASGSSLAVVGNQIQDANGNSVIFRGVNTEGIANVFANTDFAHNGHGPIGAYLAKMVGTDATGNAWKPRIVRLNFEHFPCTDATRLYQPGDVRIQWSSPDIHVLPVPDWLPNTSYPQNTLVKLNGEKYQAIPRSWRADKGRVWNVDDLGYYAVGQVYSGIYSNAEQGASANRVYQVIASNPALLQSSATQPARGASVTFTVPSGSTSIFTTGNYFSVSNSANEYGRYLLTSKTATTLVGSLSADTADSANTTGSTIASGAIAVPACPTAAGASCTYPDWFSGPSGTTTVTDTLGVTWQYIGEWGTSGATQPFSNAKVFDGNHAGGAIYFSGWVDNLVSWQDTGAFSSTTPAQGLANFQAWETNVLDPTVQACIDNGMYCEITNFDFGSAADPALFQRLQDFWGVLSTSKWANNPKVLFDLWNESEDTNGYAGFAPESWAVMKPNIQTIVNLIRGNGANNLISVPTPGFNTYADTATSDPLIGTNLLYSWHGYTDFFYNNNDAHLAAALTHGKPIYIEEWGPSDWNSTTDSAGFAATLKGMGEPSFGAVNPAVGFLGWAFTDAWSPNMFVDSGLSQPTQFGLVMRQWLSDLGSDHQAPGAVDQSTTFGLPGATTSAAASGPTITVPATNPGATPVVGRKWGFCQ